MVLVIRCQTLLEDLWTIWSCCLYVFYYYHISSYSLGSIFFNVYMVLFLFNTVIYVLLLLWLHILIVYLCLTTLTEVFPCFFLSCKANVRVKPAKTGHGPHSFLIVVVLCIFFVLFYVLFVLFYVFFVLFYVLFVLWRSLYCLCVYVYCTTATGWLPNCS